MPLEFYDRFRKPLRSHQAQNVGNSDAANSGGFDVDHTIKEYQQLITELPALNRQLLLYILDLLAVFSSKSDLNRMTSSNLAAIFQPGIISHPDHDMLPAEYRLSQDVLIFLIENQDHFLVGMSGTAADEKTIKDVQSGPPAQTPTQTPKVMVGRSASNASGGADSLRKHGVRRNVSVSSKASRDTASNGVPSPLTPSTSGAFASGSPAAGVKRSNTVPTKRSPAITPSGRFQRNPDTTPNVDEESAQAPAQESNQISGGTPATNSEVAAGPVAQVQTDGANAAAVNVPDTGSQLAPTKDKKFPSIFARSPQLGPVDVQGRDARTPNKLKKKQRIPGSANESAHSSQASLTEDSRHFQTPLISPDLTSQAQPGTTSASNPTVMNTAATPVTESPPNARASLTTTPEHQKAGDTLRPNRSPEPSLHSRSSMTDPSDLDGVDDLAIRGEKGDKQRHNWRHRFSSSAKKANGESSPLAPPPLIGQNAGAGCSGSSFGSAGYPRKSFTGDSQATQSLGADANSTGYPSVVAVSSQESADQLKDQHSGTDQDKKGGIFGKIKAKLDKSREDRREREAEKERAKSPLRQQGQTTEHQGSRHSLNAFAQEHLMAHRPRSMDRSRDEAPAPEPSQGNATHATSATSPQADASKDGFTHALTTPPNAQTDTQQVGVSTATGQQDWKSPTSTVDGPEKSS